MDDVILVEEVDGGGELTEERFRFRGEERFGHVFL